MDEADPQEQARISRLATKIHKLLTDDALMHRDVHGNVVLMAIGFATRRLLHLVPPTHRDQARALVVEILDTPPDAREVATLERMHGRPN